jgi:SAM-dependent methyltransferase
MCEYPLVSAFYDKMAGLYHLIFRDWDESIERQAQQLAGVIQERWGATARTILDISCGIGTQSIGLARLGFQVTASDLSEGAIARAKEEAKRRSAAINFSVSDMRTAYAHHQRQFDVVISADNSITHLLDDDELLAALRQIYECVRPGGGCLLTVRDYDREERGTGILKPYGVRDEGGKRYIIFQVWDFIDQIYDLSMYFVVDDRGSERPATHVMRTRYYAIGIEQLLVLLRRAGFTSAERIDGRFYQPILVADRKA